MTMKQITIVTPSRPDVLADIAEIMASVNVNIETLDAETIGDSTVAIMTVDKYDIALAAFAGTHLRAISEEAIVVRLDDRPGELARITRRFREAGVALRSIRIVRRTGDTSIVAISADRSDEAMRLVEDILVS